MIYHASMRSDIPAFYSKWFYNRIKQGFFLVRNPFNHDSVTEHSLEPSVVDLLMFCSKNPRPMLNELHLLKQYKQSWHITLTGYDKDFEPNVPKVDDVIDSIKYLSKTVGSDRISWRYDPIIINNKYNLDFHIASFEKIATELIGSVENVIISFVHIYDKLRTNADIQPVTTSDKMFLIKKFYNICTKVKITLKLCGEILPSDTPIDQSGCENLGELERKVGSPLVLPHSKPKRVQCNCYLGLDMGSYNSCPHLCKYCYANNSVADVVNAYNNHDCQSPILIGPLGDNKITVAKDKSYKTEQLSLW